MPRAKILMAASVAALILGVIAPSAHAAQSACDGLALPTVAKNASWRIVAANDPQSTRALWACDRHAAGRLRTRRLLATGTVPSGSQSVQLRGDIALVSTVSFPAAGTTRTQRRAIDLRDGTVLPALPDETTTGTGEATQGQRVTTAFTGLGAIASAAYPFTGTDSVRVPTAVETYDAAGFTRLPLAAQLVTGPPTGDSIYVRMPDASVRRLQLGGPPARILWAPDTALRWQTGPTPTEVRASWPKLHDLAPLEGAATDYRWFVREHRNGRAEIRSTVVGSTKHWPLKRGAAPKLRLLAANGDVLIVRGRFPGAEGPRVRVYTLGRALPELDIAAADLTQRSTAVTLGGYGEWAVSTRYGILVWRSGAVHNIGHPGAYDLATIVLPNNSWSLYLTDAGHAFRVPTAQL